MAKYDADARARMAKSGEAMPDGSYPIADREDLQAAIHAVGRGNGDHDAIRKHIMRRAKALGLTALIPENWMASGAMGGSNSARSALLRGSVERRMTTKTECEIRAGSNGLLHFEGVFVRFDDPYSVTDRWGTYTETADPKVLHRTLSLNPDTVLNVNHTGLPLARTTSGYLTLSTSERAGIAVAELEPRDPDVQAVQYKVDRGDMPDMSWAFRCIADTWSDDETDRRLMEASIDGGDVSIVTTGANRNTGGSFRNALQAFADFDKVLIEARAETDFDLAELREAHDSLGRLIRELTPRITLSVKAAELELLLAR